MVERVNQAQSLIEKLLCSRDLGRNRMVQIAQPGHHRDRLRCCHGVILSGGNDCETNTNNDCETNHDCEGDRFQSFKVARFQSEPSQQFHADLLLKRTNRTSIVTDTNVPKTLCVSIVQTWPRKQPPANLIGMLEWRVR